MLDAMDWAILVLCVLVCWGRRPKSIDNSWGACKEVRQVTRKAKLTLMMWRKEKRERRGHRTPTYTRPLALL